MDLKFPHHENEIAQSCAATGDGFANLWMHNGFVNVDNEKMSKSLGNFFRIRDVLDSGMVRDPEVLRYFLASSHYRGPDQLFAGADRAGGRGADAALHGVARRRARGELRRRVRRLGSSRPRWTTTSTRRKRSRRCRRSRPRSTARRDANESGQGERAGGGAEEARRRARRAVPAAGRISAEDQAAARPGVRTVAIARRRAADRRARVRPARPRTSRSRTGSATSSLDGGRHPGR